MSDQNVLGIFSLADEIERFHPGEGESGRRAEGLIKTEGLRVVLVTMHEGASLNEHSAPGPITIHTLRGEMLVSVGDEEVKLAEGGLISIAAGVRHAVRALEEGAFLLTIAFAGGGSKKSAAEE
jgi:quercetin dioxygenase-like cupin family protein